MAVKYIMWTQEAGEVAAEDAPTSLAHNLLRDPLICIGIRGKTNQREA